METLLVIGVVLAALMLLWVNGLASIALRYDHSLNTFQKVAQGIVVWALPYFGAIIILHLVFQHMPGVIPISWIPWPFKSMVHGTEKKRQRTNDNNSALDGFTDESGSYESSVHHHDGD